MTKETNYTQLFQEFSNLTILIIGDVMVDSYLWGKVERISPEAPIPIVALKKRENRMGGAANVAMNIHSMGAKPILCSVIGTDEKGQSFLDILAKEGITSEGIYRSPNRITTTKFRIFGNNTQMLRVDEEVEHDLSAQDHEELLSIIKHILDTKKIDGIIFQDYNKGVITPSLIAEVVAHAKQKNIPITVDPKKRNFEAYKGVTLFKPNLKELKEGIKGEFNPENREEIVAASQNLRVALEAKYILTTLSEQGVMISLEENCDHKTIYIPAHMRSVADVSGAGDTVISVASLCLALNRSPYEIAYISNLAGGLVCEETGVVPIKKEKLLKEVLALL